MWQRTTRGDFLKLLKKRYPHVILSLLWFLRLANGDPSIQGSETEMISYLKFTLSLYVLVFRYSLQIIISPTSNSDFFTLTFPDLSWYFSTSIIQIGYVGFSPCYVSGVFKMLVDDFNQIKFRFKDVIKDTFSDTFSLSRSFSPSLLHSSRNICWGKMVSTHSFIYTSCFLVLVRALMGANCLGFTSGQILNLSFQFWSTKSEKLLQEHTLL